MELHLIAHKVRGDATFDVAHQMEMADGPWWIIPTSGHRAYPYWSIPLNSVIDLARVPPMPEGHQDHYRSLLELPNLDSILKEAGLL